MIRTIKKILGPILREKKFTGVFPHFFRQRNGHIDLLTIQFSRYGGGFVVEVSYVDKERNNIYVFKDLQPEKLRVSHSIDRLRLGSMPQQGISDHWFKYDKKISLSPNTILESVAKEVVPFLENQAEEWWRSKYIS